MLSSLLSRSRNRSIASDAEKGKLSRRAEADDAAPIAETASPTDDRANAVAETASTGVAPDDSAPDGAAPTIAVEPQRSLREVAAMVLAGQPATSAEAQAEATAASADPGAAYDQVSEAAPEPAAETGAEPGGSGAGNGDRRTMRAAARRRTTAIDFATFPLDANALDNDTAVEPGDGEAADGSVTARLYRRAAEFEDVLTQGEAAAADALRAAMPNALVRRVAGGRKLCLLTHLPDKSWIETLKPAFAAVLARLAAERGAGIGLDVAVHGIETSWRATPFFPVDLIARSLACRHVVVPVLAGEVVDPALAVLADLDADIDLGPSTLLAAVRRAFPDAANWPNGVSPARVQPRHIDLALQRAGSASEAFTLLEQLAAAETKGDRSRAKEQEKQREKTERDAAAATKPTNVLHPSEPRLEDLHGYGEAAEWARDLVADLGAYRTGALAWSEVDTGCVFHGPPGTGKTLLAAAIAASAGLPFIATSYADWQSQGDGHSGDVVKAIRQRFADAAAASPSILFIDEIDAVASRGQTRRHDDWWRMIVGALLEELDGTTRREGVVVLAACNDPSTLDPALVRSGRLDRRFRIGLPDEAALARIFAHHLPHADGDAFETAAAVLAGTVSGADVQRIAREARRLARREKRSLMAADLLAVAMPPDRRTPAARRLVAVHEAGHAVAMLAQGQVPEALSIVSGGGTHGGVRRRLEGNMGRLAELEREIVVALAGRAAEELILGEPSAGSGGVENSDLARATDLAKAIAGTLGLGNRLLHDGQVDGLTVETHLQRLYTRALLLISTHRAAVKALAELALEKRVLTRRALEDFALEHGLGAGHSLATEREPEAEQP